MAIKHPIVFFQSWGEGGINDLEYLEASIASAKASFFENDIHLLGDVPAIKFTKVKQHALKSYSKRFLNFSKNYRHVHAISPYHYLLAAVGRLCFLADFAESFLRRPFIYIESDVIVRSSIFKICELVENYKLAYCLSRRRDQGNLGVVICNDYEAWIRCADFIIEKICGPDFSENDTEMRYLAEFYELNSADIFDLCDDRLALRCDFSITDIRVNDQAVDDNPRGDLYKKINTIGDRFECGTNKYATLHLWHYFKRDWITYVPDIDVGALLPVGHQYSSEERLARMRLRSDFTDSMQFDYWSNLSKLYPDYWLPSYEMLKHEKHNDPEELVANIWKTLGRNSFCDAAIFSLFYFKHRKWRDAITYFRSCAKEFPESFVHQELLQASLKYGGEFDEAIDIGYRVLDNFFYNPRSFKNLAATLVDIGRFKEAGDVLNKGKENFPHYPGFMG